MSRCDAIAEALVLDEALSADDRAHVEGCAACQRLTSLPGLLAASARTEPPRPGFSARMMVAARERIGQRRRRRFATFTFALAAAGASAVAVDRRLMRDDAPRTTPGAAVSEPAPTLEPEVRAELESLLSFRRAMAPAADWDAIEAPVAPYRHVLHQGGSK